MAHNHPVIDMDKHFIIDPITRAITNAESKKNLLMQNDHNSEQFSFEIPCKVEGHDVMNCNRVEIHYNNIDSTKRNSSLGVYMVNDMHLSEDGTKVIFTWLVSEQATIHAGSLSFLILFACTEGDKIVYRWNTGINTSIAIAKGMYNGDFIVETYPDILAQWYHELKVRLVACEDVTSAARIATTDASNAADAANSAADAANEAANMINTSTVYEYATQAKNSAESASKSADEAVSAAKIVVEIVDSMGDVATKAELDTVETNLQEVIDAATSYPKVKRRNVPPDIYNDGTEPIQTPFKFGMGVTGVGEDDVIEVRIDYDNPNMTDDKAVYREAMREAMITTDSIVANDDGSYTIWLMCDGEFPVELRNMYFLIINHGPGVSW